MIKRKQQWQKWVQVPLVAAIAAGLASPVSAFNFNIGDIDGAFDTRITAAVGWRTKSQHKDHIAQGNLGPEFAGTNQGASTSNYDDGNLNFNRGDTYSRIIRGSSELYLNKDFYGGALNRVGGFARGRYYYDYQLKDRDMARDDVGQRRTLNSDARSNAAGGELLDAYVWTDWTVNDIPLSIRYGRQVFNWGESTFIQGGINTTNPIDVGAIRSPGSELREALLPIEALSISAGLTDNLTAMGYVQFDWSPVRTDDCGTFFSTNDFVADGCGPVIADGSIPESTALDQGLVIEREADRRPSGKDQFGVGLTYYASHLGETEFGLYHVRYHSRLPYVSGRVANPAVGQNLPTYYIEYAEDIKLYGASMNTNLPGGWSMGAEYSFRENMPLQWNAFEQILGGLQDPASKLFLDRTNGGDPDLVAAQAGETAEGFDRFKVSQAQATFIRFFDRIMGASRMTFISEVGANYVHGLPSLDEARFGRSGTFGIGDYTVLDEDGNVEDTCAESNINPSNCTNDGFVTSFSWGYRTAFVFDYPNAFMGANLSPALSFSHDVKGYAPEPGGNFQEGRKAIGLSLTASYQNNYEARIGYTNFFGGKYNELVDRDHVTASVSYAF
ncbi:MAG: DUF1302 domain-containing protein [Halomonadaceae bacterium]|nr:MAG: DUF1302 domain-containing protein [Halomonadaceae bacterium]